MLARPVGAAICGVVGCLLGAASSIFAMQANTPGRQFGGGMDMGKTYLTGEAGPELITAGTKSAVTANTDLQQTFNTQALEAKMESTVSELSTANKNLTNMVKSVNTLVAVESRALKAVETTARKDRNMVGNV